MADRQGTSLEDMLDALGDRGWNLDEFMRVGEAFDKWLINHLAAERVAVEEQGLEPDTQEGLVENAFMAGYKFAQREPTYVKRCGG